MDIDFPQYLEDEQGDIAAFALALCDSDTLFVDGLKIMLEKDYETSGGKTLLSFAAPLQLTLNRVKFMNQKGLSVRNKSTISALLDENQDMTPDLKASILELL